MIGASSLLVSLVALAGSVDAQTFRRTAACPELGCLFPPTHTDFLVSQKFDIRQEIQAPVNGTQAFNNGVVSPDFTLTITPPGGSATPLIKYFKLDQPKDEVYNFTWYEDLFYQKNNSASLVNVIAKSYRYVSLDHPGDYVVSFKYHNNTMETEAIWTVRKPVNIKKAKNVVLFIGDGMTTSMITAARLLGHKSINGKYLTKLQLDKAYAYGSQMTHSLDSFITDSANSATALYSGKKSTVNALNAYTDSTGKAFGDPKFESVFEMGRRIKNKQIGIVTTAYLADATPAAVCAHTSQRSQSNTIVDQFLDGVGPNYTWNAWNGPDVIMGGGGSNFIASAANNNTDKVARFQSRGYQFAYDNTTLHKLDNSKRMLGLYASVNMATWLDRNVAQYQKNLDTWPMYNGTVGAKDQPGLKDMTLKALDILVTRSKVNNTGFMLMSEAASIDKQMHIADYDRALGELLELDNTVKATINHLDKLGELENTLIVVTADHGHGFDVYGGADTAYLAAQTTNDTKRDAVGVYVNSGLSGYQVTPGSNPQNFSVVPGPQGDGFPTQWTPRYAAAYGLVSVVDKYENFVTSPSPRNSTVLDPASTKAAPVYRANPNGTTPGGFWLSGNMPVNEDQGVHSLTDVPIYAWGPSSEQFRGVHNSPDIAFMIAEGLGLDCGDKK
ncbi:BQ5605_C022g09432 [Microbotryum silenes-dioicae]|uniref:alkaline phosphatase n=1 Tax=Microbotryum silenes-dioicae TaxID=796604 RepID=A0A2X0PEF2_9BASI|nr:BQ5605_C022g09432 [Microbotryum silenes-dioicae]